MAERTKPYRIRTEDGIIVRGIPPGLDPSDPQLVEYVQRARDRGDKDSLFPYIQETELAKGLVEGGKRVGLNLAEMVGLAKPETVQAFEDEMAQRPRTMGRATGSFGTELLGTAGIGGPVAGGIAKGLSLIPKLPRLAPALALGGRGAMEGATEGAILAGPGERQAGAQQGVLLGGAMGAGMGVLAGGFRTPDEAAVRLMDMGVDLTPGQMKPQGSVNLLEQTMLDIPGLGSVMGTARRGAQEDFAAAMVNAARPPGAPKVSKQNVQEMARRVYAQFEPAYEVAKGYPVYQGWDTSLGDQFKVITNRSDILADDAERKMVNNFLQAQLSRTKRIADKNAQGLVDSGDLLKVRSKIREKARDEKLGNRQRMEVADMLDSADQAITRELVSQLPADIMPYLRDVDRQYAKYKIVENAAAATKRGTFPTPYQWSSAAHKAATKKQQAHGTGMLMPEAQAGMEVFETTAPRTGARNLTMGALGGGAMGFTDPTLAATVLGSILAGSATRTGRLMSVGRHPVQQGIEGLVNTMPASAVTTLGSIARATPTVYGQQE